MSDAGWTQCAGTTQRGTRCRHMVWKHYGFTMCTMHRHQEPELMVTEPIAEKDARLANLCCGHAACQREVRERMAEAWDEGVAATTGYAMRLNPYRVTSPDGRAAQDHGSSA